MTNGCTPDLSGVILKFSTTPNTIPFFSTTSGLTHCIVLPMALEASFHPNFFTASSFIINPSVLSVG